MTRTFSNVIQNLLIPHSTVLATILLGAIVDLLAFSFFTRGLGLSEALSVIFAILIAALFNFLILNKTFTPEKSKLKSLRDLSLYLASVVILIGVRAIVLKFSIEMDITREFIYLFSMGISFFINWLVLSCLFKIGGPMPSERTR